MRLAKTSCFLLACVLLLGNALFAHGQRMSDRNLLNAMQSELTRSMEQLADQPNPPFYLSYEITDQYNASVEALFGETTSYSEAAGSYFDIDLRVGNPDYDNTRLATRSTRQFTTGALVSEDAVQSTLWLMTDGAYKNASEQLLKATSEQKVTIETDKGALDLASAPKSIHSELSQPIEFPREVWEKRLARVSQVFSGHPDLTSGFTRASVKKEARYFVNSEGSRIQTDDNVYTVGMFARTRADDGSYLSLNELFHAHRASGLPSDKELTNHAEELVQKLIALRKAPRVDPYTGPAILSGRASAVLFHEILGHRLEGHRLKNATDAQTFKDFVGEEVLPDNFSVVFDPAISKFGKTDLIGTYHFDNEGVRGQRVEVISNGILRSFLLGRSTLVDFKHSNGHGRKAVGFNSVARQSNLFVEVENPTTTEGLEQQLIELLKERNLEYGLYFDDIVGGYTITQRSLPNSFTVTPVLVYKIYQDGTRELVRGVDLIGTPLTVFDSVIAGADDATVFNGQCGAESGDVPVAAISPSILVGQIEVQRKPQSQSILPILTRPGSPQT